MSERLLLRAGTLYQSPASPAVRDAAVEIVAGRVARVGRATDFGDQASFDLDFGDGVAMAGLIDPHVHLELTPEATHAAVRETWLADRDAGRLRQTAARHATETLHSGCTTVRDCGSSLGLLELRDAIERGEADGPRIVACGPPVTTSGGQLWWMGSIADDRPALAAAVESLADAGVDAIKVIASGGFLTAESDPAAAQYTAADLAVLVEVATAAGLGTVAHANAAASIVAAAEAGVGAIDHFAWLAGDAAGWSEAAAERVARSGCVAGLSAAGTLRGLLEIPDGADEIRARAAYLRWHRDAGGGVAVHSDAGGHLTRFDGFGASLRVAQLALGASNAEVLTLATAGAATLIGLEEEIGSLAPGRVADILILDDDPLVDLRALQAVRAVLRDGRVVGAAGESTERRHARGDIGTQ